MNSSELKGVILAAGKGNRMRHLGVHSPKPLLPLCNRPAIYRQLELMREHGVREVTVVIGHLGHEIVRALTATPPPGLRIRFVEQAEMLGIAHAVGRLEPHVDSPFLLMLGDVVFTTRGLSSMLDRFSSGDAGAVLAVKEEEDVAAIRRNFSIDVDEQGFATRVMEKPRVVHNNLKGCGIYLFDLTIFDAIRRTPRTAARDEYEITDAIQILIDTGQRVAVAPVIEWDMNLTVPCDLLKSNLYCLEETGLGEMVGARVQMAEGTTLHRAIIGDGARIVHPIRLTDSLVLPGALVEARDDLSRVVASRDGIIQCS